VPAFAVAPPHGTALELPVVTGPVHCYTVRANMQS
jgi:hypothetical protein